LLSASVTLLGFTGAQAAPVDLFSTNNSIGIYYGSFAQNDFPAQTEQAIYLHGQNGVTSGFGSIGVNDNTHNDILFSTSNPLTPLSFSNGLAQIDGYNPPGNTPEAIWKDLTITTPGKVFTDFIFRSTNAADVTIKAYGLADALLGSFSFPTASVTGDDYKRIMVLAENTVFTKLVLSSLDGWGSIKDMDISGWGPPPRSGDDQNPLPTPIPGAFLLMGTVLAGGAGFAKWRRRREQLAES
jgi:hypothetical protein